jgi:predicted AAA+ superfamily ATPase
MTSISRIKRIFNAPKKNSYFLFGARGTGKSTLLDTLYKVESILSKEVLYINLLDPSLEEEYQKNPNLLKEKINENPHYKKVILDEIQKLPALLDVIHFLIEKNKNIQFIMTGSSARKLKRGGANLLGGRAFSLRLHPFTFLEAPNSENLIDLLSWGSLPKIYEYNNTEDKIRFLRTYTQTYLKEEIQLEQIVRNIHRFRQFLELSAQCNGEILNYLNIANQSGLDEKTIARYFEIMVDTMVGFFLEPYDESVRVRQSQKPKFYLFDTGVYRHLAQLTSNKLISGSSEFGKVFEQFIICECMRLNDYFEKDFRFYYLRTKDGVEIDLIVKKNSNTRILIEIKSTDHTTQGDLTHLLNLSEDIKHKEKWIICNEKTPRKTDSGIRILPWRQGLKELFDIKI